MRTRHLIKHLTLAAPLFAAFSPADAEIIAISNIAIDGFQVTTPIPDAGSGIASVTINTDTRRIDIAGSYSNMLGNVIAAHLHGPADFGVDSPLIIAPLTHTGGFEGTFTGSRALTSRQLDDVLAGLTYINVHTEAHTGGEIRGQIVVPAPATAALLGLALTTARRRR